MTVEAKAVVNCGEEETTEPCSAEMTVGPTSLRDITAPFEVQATARH